MTFAVMVRFSPTAPQETEVRMFCIASVESFNEVNHFEIPTYLPLLPTVVYRFHMTFSIVRVFLYMHSVH